MLLSLTYVDGSQGRYVFCHIESHKWIGSGKEDEWEGKGKSDQS